jgi:hypothetical protein
MLDTLHFNGMNSSLEALAVGLPVVTLPTQLQRGRHTRAMYLKLVSPTVWRRVRAIISTLQFGSAPSLNS